MWASLYDHYPHVAAALVEHLAALPLTWRQDLFQTDNINHVPAATTNDSPGPETAPYSTSWEDCGACSEAQDLCRYHAGLHAGEDYIRELLATLAADPLAPGQLQERHDDLEHQRVVAAATETTIPLSN